MRAITQGFGESGMEFPTIVEGVFANYKVDGECAQYNARMGVMRFWVVKQLVFK
jgi:hypothetical protein